MIPIVSKLVSNYVDNQGIMDTLLGGGQGAVTAL